MIILDLLAQIVLIIFAITFYLMIVVLIWSYIVRRRLRQQFRMKFKTWVAGENLEQYDLVWLNPKDNKVYKINE